jgi:signal peptidase II
MQFIIFLAVALTTFVFDQATKFWVVDVIPLGQSLPLGALLSLTHVKNTGAAFGFMPNGNGFFVVATFLVLGFLIFSHRRLSAQGRLPRWGLALLWGGALGNLVDRLCLGHVTDFLDVHWRHWHWYTFNVADSAITLAVVFLLLDGFTSQKCSPSSST